MPEIPQSVGVELQSLLIILCSDGPMLQPRPFFYLLYYFSDFLPSKDHELRAGWGDWCMHESTHLSADDVG